MVNSTSIAELNEPVASNIERIVSEKGIKKQFVAIKAGLTANALSDILNGRRIIRPAEIVLLATALDVPPNELFVTA